MHCRGGAQERDDMAFLYGSKTRLYQDQVCLATPFWRAACVPGNIVFFITLKPRVQ